MVKKKENRGGPRPNSGPKPQTKTISVKVKGKILKAARELAKEYGEPIEKAMLRMIYKAKIQDSVKASVFKTYLEAMIAKATESTVTTRDETPKIYLPERRDDPALKVVKGGK